MHVTAAVDIHAVAVGIDLEVVDREIVDAGREDREVPAVQDRDVTQRDVAAVLERDRLVGDAGLLGDRSRPVAFTQAPTPDQAGTENRDVVEILAPDQAVVPVAVTEVLIGVEGVRLGLVIAIGGSGRQWVGRDQSCALVQIEADVTAQMHRMGQIVAGRKMDAAAPGRRRGIDRTIDRDGIERLTVADGAIVPDVEAARLLRAGETCDRRREQNGTL